MLNQTRYSSMKDSTLALMEVAASANKAELQLTAGLASKNNIYSPLSTSAQSLVVLL
jgi:hypothetical protein